MAAMIDGLFVVGLLVEIVFLFAFCLWLGNHCFFLWFKFVVSLKGIWCLAE